MANRKKIPKNLETAILIACHRRCCLCFYHDELNEVRRGQIAHLNHDRADHQLENLVYLCLEHHDEYDSRTSQSKGLKADEVRHFRDRLCQHFYNAKYGSAKPEDEEKLSENQVKELDPLSPVIAYNEVRQKFPEFSKAISRPWQFSFEPSSNEMEYFAYLSSNHCDGVCLIERIDIPDSRIVIACVEPIGNPGQSITNAVEELVFQVCERFDISPNRLIWLENYEVDEFDDWNMVCFQQSPPAGPFQNPQWIPMTVKHWASISLSPMKRPSPNISKFARPTRLKKMFKWPN